MPSFVSDELRARPPARGNRSLFKAAFDPKSGSKVEQEVTEVTEVRKLAFFVRQSAVTPVVIVITPCSSE
jgi:hypothetical protein